MLKTNLNEKLDEMEEDSEIAACPYCNHDLQLPYWESRYNGTKAKCKECKVTWNLS